MTHILNAVKPELGVRNQYTINMKFKHVLLCHKSDLFIMNTVSPIEIGFPELFKNVDVI